MNYSEFIRSKSIVAEPTGITDPKGISEKLFEFQRACVRFGLERGRVGMFQGTGLGKTLQQAVWSQLAEDYTNAPSLIVAPLAVAHQTVAMAKSVLGMDITFAEHGGIVGDRGVYITNYGKLHRFDAKKFRSVALDESSIIKNFNGATLALLMDMFHDTPFRSAWTATPSPNDYMELGTHAEFLGIMKRSEMLATFFVHDGGETQKWRLKGHAESAFWKWLASWSICITHPRDIGFDQEGYDLPALRMHEVIVDTNSKPLPGELFALPAKSMMERKSVRRDTVDERTEALRSIIESSPDDSWLAWSNLNTEAEAISKAAKMTNVTGSDSDDVKEKRVLEFASGDLKRLSSKSSICGFGINFQVCHRMGFLGLSDSWESLYQSIRRCYRFGQKHPVDVHIVISSLEGAVLQNIKRKELDAQRMQKALVSHMADLTKRQLTGARKETIEYKPKKKLELPSWIAA